jgi:hypothetical protein
MAVMTGPRRRARGFHSVFRYRLGNCTPAKTNCTPRTSRLKYKVTVLRLAWEPVYSRGLTKLVACGEKVTPARRDITGELIVSLDFLYPRWSEDHTSFRKIKLLLEKIRHQSKQGDEPSKHRTNDVEVRHSQGRHIVLSFL